MCLYKSSLVTRIKTLISDHSLVQETLGYLHIQRENNTVYQSMVKESFSRIFKEQKHTINKVVCMYGGGSLSLWSVRPISAGSPDEQLFQGKRLKHLNDNLMQF